jgi:ketosteroid isomerase-like protein
MTVRSNLEVVRELFERFGNDDVEAVLELVAEDFEVEVPASMSAEPDVYRGHDGVRRYLHGFDGMMEDVRFEPLEFLEEGGFVIVVMRLVGRGVSSGIEAAQDAVVVHEIEDGKVRRMRPFPSLDAARDALGEFD